MNKKNNLLNVFYLLVPGFVLLISFTHIPAVKTLMNSFYSTAKGRRASKFVGLENYETLWLDATFWKVFSNDFGVKISFSSKTKIVKPTTKYKFITPATSNIAIKNQQQNTQ